MNFPTGFAAQTEPLPIDLLDPATQETYEELQERGYVLHCGLTPEYAEKIRRMSLQPHIAENCPKDSALRFADRQATEQWLSKQRLVFLLLKKDADNLRLAGYGWCGPGRSSHVPEGETTTAPRIGSEDQGKGLGTPFSQLMIEATAQLYDARHFWLETWASNAGAVHIYHKLGFTDVDQAVASRPTIDGQTVPDTRVYMYRADT